MLRVFGPPEDLVKDIFYGSQGGGTQQRKARELEKKRAYAAELQAQMQEKERQKQLERMQRFGVPPPGNAGGLASSFHPQQSAAPANLAAPQTAAMLSSCPPARSPAAATSQQSSPAAYYQQSSWQPAEAAAYPLRSGSYDKGGGYGQGPQVAPGPNQSPGSGEQQQQLLQSLANWPDNAPSGIGSAGSQYFMQQQQQQPPAMPGQPAPGTYAVCQQQQLQQQPYMAMSVAGQHDIDTGSPSACYYSSSSPQSDLHGAPCGRQSVAAAGGMPPWGAQSIGGYAAEPASGGSMHSIGSSNKMCSPAYGAPGMSISQGYWGPGGMGNHANPAYENSPAAAAATAAAAAGPDAKTQAAKAKKDAYRAELEAQIRDKAARKAAEKSATAAEEARKEAEVAAYSPWGRGGAGAPLRDANGQVVSDLRGRRCMQDETQQQLQQQQQQRYQAAVHNYSSMGMSDVAGQATAGAACCCAAADEQLLAPDKYHQQQQQQQRQQGSAPAAAGLAAGPPPGAPPLLCFRSDKAFMTADEVARRQQAQLELQKELDQQIQEKKRRKELEQRQAAEEAQREEERLAAEQARLAEQYEAEQMKQKSKARITGDLEDQVTGAWTAAKQTAEQERQKSLDGRRRSQAQFPGEEPSRNFHQHLSAHQAQRLASQASSGRDNMGLDSQQQQQPDMLQFQVQQRQQQQQMDQQQRQQLMLEAMRLEEEKMRQTAAQEVERLRSEMQAQASALRDVVERQGGEVAVLRAAAAAAEAESQAAKTELAQVRRDFLRKSQELQHETLSTILADYGTGPVSSMAAAYHPSPIRHIELDMPSYTATVRRSVPARAEAGGLAAAEYGQLAGGPSAVEVFESLLQQGKPPTGSLATGGAATAAAAAAGDASLHPAAHWSLSGGRPASVPLATAAPVANSVTGPSWLANTAVGKSTNVRSSMLVSESTFIFPSGLAPPAPAVDEDGNVMEYVGMFDSMEEAAAAAAGGQNAEALGLQGSSWDFWHQQQQRPLQHYQRQTSSAPGSSNAGRAATGLQTSLSSGRQGVMTPGGSDLTAVVNRNADKLQVLSSMPAHSDPEALDEFLAKFVNKPGQPNQRTVATPPSRLMTPPTSSVHLPSRHPSDNSRTRPPRYSSSATDAVAAAGNATANADISNHSLYPGLSDTLEKEMSRMNVRGEGSTAAAAQQRLLSAGRVSAGGYRGAAAADGSSAAAEQHTVEDSAASMLGTSQWLPSNGHGEL